MEQLKDNQSLPELSSQIVTMITTEHYNLQTGRSMTVADANGRCTLFIGAVSGALIAIAFTGQVSRMGTAFFVFSLVLVPSLLLMGLITFERVLQSGIEDLTYARGITRIRHLYLEHAPQLRPSFLLAADDDSRRPMLKVGIRPSWWQVFLTTAGMLAAINSVLLGGLCGPAAVCPVYLPLAGLYERWSRDLPGELGHPSALSMGAMEAPGAEPGGPLSKPG